MNRTRLAKQVEFGYTVSERWWDVGWSAIRAQRHKLKILSHWEAENGLYRTLRPLREWINKGLAS